MGVGSAHGRERRRERRVAVRLRVQMEPGGLSAFAEDLSTRGTFVRSARVLKPGTAVILTLYPDGRPRQEQGIVRWARRVPVQLIRDVRGGMGIQFLRPVDPPGARS